MTKTVLLTGVSGYIGLHCAKELLNAGYQVRGSVRNKSKEAAVLTALGNANVDTKNLGFVHLDLTSDMGWNDAAKGCDFILHVASPFAIANPKHEDEMIVPAVEGTRRVLRAAKNANVQRVVLTSSVVSMMGSMTEGTFGPSDWTDVNDPKVNIYVKSKTLAEKAAWDFVQRENTPELIVMAPGGVFGPSLGDDITGQSMAMIDQMLRGKMPMVPRASFPMVDVRDVAKLHVEALKNDDAVGKRIIVAGAKGVQFNQMAQTLIDAGYKGPSAKIAPNFLLRFMALFSREAKGMVNFLGMDLNADNSETLTLFNWKPISTQDSLLDAAKVVKEITA